MSDRSTTSLPFFLETGQSLFTAFTSLSRAGRISMMQAHRSLGVFPNRGDLYGHQVAQLADALGTGETIREIQRKHTLLPYLTAALSEERADWWYELLASQPQQSRGMLPSLLPKGGGSASQAIAFCVQCSQDDKALTGIPAWWIWHQIPHLGICLKHRTPLLRTCQVCGVVFCSGKSGYLPGEKCSICKWHPTTKQLKNEVGVGPILNRLHELSLIGHLPMLRPLAWGRRVTNAVAALGGQVPAIEKVCREVAKRWPDCGRTMSNTADLAFPAGFVHRQINLQSRSFEILGSLVVNDALQSLIGEDELEQMAAYKCSASNGEDEMLWCVASALDLPIGAPRLLMSRKVSLGDVLKTLRCDISKIRNLTQALPAPHREIVDQRSRRTLDEYKTIVLEQKKDGATRRRQIPEYVVSRIRRSDAAWLDDNLPALGTRAHAATTRSRCRTQLLEALGGRARVSRTEIASTAEGRWALRFDRDWLISELSFKSYHGERASDPERKMRFRSIVVAALKCDPTISRRELSRQNRLTALWLSANDSEWFDAVCPKRTRWTNS